MTARQATRRKREVRVDRQALADALNARMDEIAITQAELTRISGIAASTIRKMQKAQGTDHYGNGVLARISEGLRWPEDKLHRIFYCMPEQDPVAPSGVELVKQAIMAELEPYLAKIDAIDERLSVVMEEIRRINSRIDAVLGPAVRSPEDD